LFMNKPEFIINSATGKKLMKWCAQGLSLDAIKLEIADCLTVEGLRHLYKKYPSMQDQIEPLLVTRKNEIEGVGANLVSDDSIVEPENKD